MLRRNSASATSQVVQKQQLNVYTVMLIVAFCAITLACLLLYLELRRWGSFPWWKAETGGGGGISQVRQFDDPQLPVPRLRPVDSSLWS